MDTFRGVLQTKELSERTLLLTEMVIDCNSANYSAWHYRRLCLEALQSDLRGELVWTASVALDTPKNYQLWHHRRCLLEKLSDLSTPICQAELDLTREVLSQDAKNYHAWSHRQWCLRFFTRSLPEVVASPGEAAPPQAESGSAPTPSSNETGDRPNINILTDELAFIDSLLHQDVRNNSAWNQRFFVLSTMLSDDAPADSATSDATAAGTVAFRPSFTRGMSSGTISSELSYAGSKLLLASHNESAWGYIEGLSKQGEWNQTEHISTLYAILEALDEFPIEVDDGDGSSTELIDRCAAFPNRFAQSLLVELWSGSNVASTNTSAIPSDSNLLRASASAAWLAEELDTIRQKYWKWREQEIEEKRKVLQATRK